MSSEGFTLYISFEKNKTIVHVRDNATNKIVATFSGENRDRVLNAAEKYVNDQKKENKKK